MVMLQIPKIILVHGAGINPNYTYQQEIMEKKEMTMTDWVLESSSATDILYNEIIVSIALVILYFVVLFILKRLRTIRLENTS